MSKVNQLKMGSIISYIQMAVSILIGLLYTPIMIRLLGQSEYGLYNTVSSTISILSLLSLGFNGGYLRYYAKYKKDNREDLIAKLNGLFLIVFLIIGIIAFACGFFLTEHLELVFEDGLTKGEYEIAKVLMWLMTFNLSISFPMSVFQNIISAHERYVFLKLLGVLKTVIGPLVTLPLLLMGYRSIAMVVVSVCTALLTDVIYLIYAFAVLRIKFVFHHFEKGLFKELFIFTFFIALNMIVDQINWNMGKFLLGRYKGTAAVAVYAVGYSLYSYYQMFSTAISGVFSPRIHRIVNTVEEKFEQRKILTDLFIKVGRIQFLVLALLATGLLFFGKAFVFFWAGDGYAESYYVMLLLVFSSTIPLIQNIGIEVQRALNKHWFRGVAYFVMAILNLIVSIFLCQHIGSVGAAIGTAASILIANGLIMNIYYHKQCNIDIISFWKNILRVAVGLIVPIIAGIVINIFFDLYNIWWFIAGVIVYSIVYCVSMWLTGMNRYEKDLIKIPCKKIALKLFHK